jgi:hypothetical protein
MVAGAPFDETDPTGLFHLPGVDSRDAEQAQDGYSDGHVSGAQLLPTRAA